MARIDAVYLQHQHYSLLRQAKGTVTDGLPYLHENYIAYGNPKAPSSVLRFDASTRAIVVISSSVVPMLMDLGISHLPEGSIVYTATNTHNGSLWWLAPELLRGEKEIHTNKSDVWALRMPYLVGFRPFCLRAAMVNIFLQEILTKELPCAHLAKNHHVTFALAKNEIPIAPKGVADWVEVDKWFWLP